MVLKIPATLEWDSRLPEDERAHVDELNASVARLNEMRAVEINISGPFAKSKIAWKLAAFQHALLHRIVALMDGTALAWNHRATLAAMLCARSLMETVALMSSFERSAADLLEQEDLGGLDGLGQHGIFAGRDPEWIKDRPELEARNVLTYIDRFDRIATGFRNHYDRLSERCHPNSFGHHFMFAILDRELGSITYTDESAPEMNAQMVLASVTVLNLVENMVKRLDDVIAKVADLQHRISPVGGTTESRAGRR
jgi:hypothetical protein